MNKINKDVYLECEQEEQCEQTIENKDNDCSQHKDFNGNTGNKFIANTIDPLEVPPENMTDLDMKRPCYKSYDDWFQIDGKAYPPGLYRHGVSKSGNIDERVCSPITVEAITSNSVGYEFGRVLRFRDSNGRWHEWGMPMKYLKGAGDELFSELLDHGLVFYNKKNHLINYIMGSSTNKRILAVSTIGWHDKQFVLPNKIIGKNQEIIFQNEFTLENDFTSLGTLSMWQENIGRLCVGNTSLLVVVSAALAGALLKPLNRQQGGGIHIVGDSSSGKSTCIEIAASVWGSPHFVRSWSATANGIEGIVSTRNDTCIVLDEIDEAMPNDIYKISYMLSNGQGKQRANKFGKPRSIQRWRTIALSTGERTLTSIMGDVHRLPNSGQLVRLLNITAEYKHGVFNELHEFASGRCFSDSLKTSRTKYYGTLGPAFLEKLISDGQDLGEFYSDINELFSKYVKSNLDERAASTLSIIALAGELCIQYNLVNWAAGDVIKACIELFIRWKNDTNGSLTEDERILQAIRIFIDKNSESRFSLHLELVSDRTIHNRAGWFKNIGGNRVFMFHGYALDEAGGKYERPRIIKALKNAGWLIEYTTGRCTKRTRVGDECKSLYYICMPEEEQGDLN